MNEWAIMQQMVAGSQMIYLQMATVLALFLVIAFRPERIKYPTIMRWSYLLLIASLLAPLLLNVIIGGLMSSDLFQMAPQRYGRSRSDSTQWIMQVPYVVGPVLLGISLLLGFSSLSLMSAEKEAARKPFKPQQPPQKHPLD
jgi:cytochrome bd-type quinol oxidase subunit 2